MSAFTTAIQPEIRKNLIRKCIEFKTDPFNAYGSVIDSISTIRFVHFKWDWDARECQKPSRFKSILYYLQAINQFIVLIVSFISVGLYLANENTEVGILVSDILILIGFTYAAGYQVSSLLYGPESEFHINEQAKLDKYFCELMGIEKPDGWNRRGILYYFCLMCNASRPFTIFLFFPFFLKSQSAMSLYYRLGGQTKEIGWVFYGLWYAFNSACSYTITNYYAVLSLGHIYFTMFWLKCITNKIKTGASRVTETTKTLHKIYRMLEIHNKLYFCSLSRVVLPVAIFFASAWFVFSVCVLIKLLDQISILTLMMITVCAVESVSFLSLQFYSCHRMTCLSEEFLFARRVWNSEPLQKLYHRSYRILRIRVGTSYSISIDNMLTWTETVINYIILLLSLF